MDCNRSFISLAALLVKVTAKMPPGETCEVCNSQAMRVVSTRVLPEPAPARINACSDGKATARSCSSLSWASKGEEVFEEVSESISKDCRSCTVCPGLHSASTSLCPIARD